MAKYIAKRVALALVTLVIVSMLTFFLMFLVPGGRSCPKNRRPRRCLRPMEEKYGLDKPVIVQYKNYMLNLLQGELGPVHQAARPHGRPDHRFPVPGFGAHRRHRAGHCRRRGRGAGQCGGAQPRQVDRQRHYCYCHLRHRGAELCCMYHIIVYIQPEAGVAAVLRPYGLENYIMPVIALGFYPTAYICRLMRSSMLDVLGQDYMRTARAKGLSQGKSLFKHALRNAILPVVTYLGPALAYTLTGSLIVEKIFTIPGLGDSFVSSITGRDYMVIMGTTIFLATLIITMNVIVDIVYKIIDPRIKLK